MEGEVCQACLLLGAAAVMLQADLHLHLAAAQSGAG